MYVDIRSSLPTNPEGEKFKKRDIIKGVTFHQSFTTGTLEGLAEYHTGPNHYTLDGFIGTPYHYGIRTNGEICILNDESVSSRLDRDTIMVLFEGCFKFGNEVEYLGVDCTEPSQEQLASARELWYDIKSRWSLSNASLYGHYHFDNPDCPGNTLKKLIEEIRNEVT